MENIYIGSEELGYTISRVFKDKGIVSIEEILSKFEDTIDELENIKDEFEEFKRDVDDNYKYIPAREQYDI